MIEKEQLLSFKELAARGLKLTGKKNASVSTINRWRTQGLAGIKLEAVQIDGVWFSSIEAFRRFGKTVTLVKTMHALNEAKRPRARRRPKNVGDELAKFAKRLSR